MCSSDLKLPFKCNFTFHILGVKKDGFTSLCLADLFKKQLKARIKCSSRMIVFVKEMSVRAVQG